MLRRPAVVICGEPIRMGGGEGIVERREVTILFKYETVRVHLQTTSKCEL